MNYRSEQEMYPAICEWLQKFLTYRKQRAEIRVFDTSRKPLNRLIQQQSLMNHLPPEWSSWTIYVDIVGFIITDATTEIAFVECKNKPLTLDHLSQLLGYSRVASPSYSFLLSPQGASRSLRSLLVTYNRMDILEYQKAPGKFSRSMVVAQWDSKTNNIDRNSIITGDQNYLSWL